MKKKDIKTPKSKKIRKLIFAKRNIFVWLFKVIQALFQKQDITHANGVHIITGYQGSGKTLFMNKIIQEVDSTKSFFVSNMKEFDGVKSFEISDLFDDNKQVKKIPLYDEYGRRLYGVILDEINLTYNKRLNRSKDYNNTFIGLIETIVSMRHQGVPRIYFLGQKLELQDTQLQSLFKYQHDIIKTKRFPFWWFYYDNGFINFMPKKLVIMHRIKSQEAYDQLIDYRKQRYKIKENDFKTYDTYALEKNYINLDNVTLN